jgi:hypothetical protein
VPEPEDTEETGLLGGQPERWALPNLPVIIDRSSVAILSKRTTDGTLRPVSAEAMIGAISGPARGTEVIKQTTRSDRRSLSRDTTRAGRLVPGKICKRESRQNDATEREHLSGLRYQVRISVEVRFLGQPIEGSPGLSHGGHRQQILLTRHLH